MRASASAPVTGPNAGETKRAQRPPRPLPGGARGDPVATPDLSPAPLPDAEGDDEQDRQPWRHGSLLPVAVILRDFASRFAPVARAFRTVAGGIGVQGAVITLASAAGVMIALWRFTRPRRKVRHANAR